MTPRFLPLFLCPLLLGSAAAQHSQVICVAPASGDSQTAFASANITRFCVQADLESREALPAPGITARAGLASPTRAPWIVANGWRFARNPTGRYVYELSPGRALLAAAEAHAHGVDAALKVDASDATALAAMLAFFDTLPAVDMPGVADVGIVDDGSALTGEVMNLLARRNLLYQIVPPSSSRFPITIAIGSAQYPREDAADPSAFALRIRRQLTDDQRSIRVFGSEVVICRLRGDERRLRVHLINYGGRDIEGLRMRVRGRFASGTAHVVGAGQMALQELVLDSGFTEFTIPRVTTYAVVDLGN
jgi:hypothetical protein